MNAQLSKSDRELLKAIYRLTRDGSVAHTGALADCLWASARARPPPRSRGWPSAVSCEHQPYRGVELTAPGRRAAVSAIRRHRIVERFLSDMLGYRGTRPTVSPGPSSTSFRRRSRTGMFVALDRPATCPHGFPIPDPDVDEIPDMPPLYALEPGDVAVVAVPGSTDPEVIEFLDTLGLRPGVTVEVKRSTHSTDPRAAGRAARTERSARRSPTRSTCGRNRQSNSAAQERYRDREKVQADNEKEEPA